MSGTEAGVVGSVAAACVEFPVFSPEQWRPVVGYEGKYEVSDAGRVRNVVSGKVLKCNIGKGGHEYVNLTGEGSRQKLHLVARLVWPAFVGPLEPGVSLGRKVGRGSALSNLRVRPKYVRRPSSGVSAVRDALTHEEFVDRCVAAHPDGGFDYSRSVYINAHEEVLIVCTKHKKAFLQSRAVHWRGSTGCKQCKREAASRRLTKTTESFVAESRRRFGDEFSYEHTVYVNTKTPVIIACSEGHLFSRAPMNHLGSGTCPVCKQSRIEREISRFLKRWSVPFEREKRFDDCRHKRTLPFDFFVANKVLIEADGAQHTDPSNRWYSESLVVRDRIKDAWAESSPYTLVRISHADFGVVEDILRRVLLEHAGLQLPMGG